MLVDLSFNRCTLDGCCTTSGGMRVVKARAQVRRQQESVGSRASRVEDLNRYLRRISHEFGLLSSDYNDTIDPACVPDLSSPQKNLIGSKRVCLLSTGRGVVKMKGSGVSVKRSIGCLGKEMAAEGGDESG